jgi:hypothetical protein
LSSSTTRHRWFPPWEEMPCLIYINQLSLLFSRKTRRVNLILNWQHPALLFRFSLFLTVISVYISISMCI